MALHVMTGLTPQLTEADLPRLSAEEVLGEPLPLLMGAALRLRLVSVEDGPARLAATMTTEEVASLHRAMDRVAVPTGDLSPTDQDALRLGAVLRAACRAADETVARILARPA